MSLAQALQACSGFAQKKEFLGTKLAAFLAEHNADSACQLLDLLFLEDSLQPLIRDAFRQVADFYSGLPTGNGMANGNGSLANGNDPKKTRRKVIEFVLDKIAKKNRMNLETEDLDLRYILAKMLISEGRTIDAAHTLSQTKLFESLDEKKNLAKVIVSLDICELALQDSDNEGDSTGLKPMRKELIETSCSRAASLVPLLSDSAEKDYLDRKYRASHAKLLEGKGKYVEAAGRYCDLLQLLRYGNASYVNGGDVRMGCADERVASVGAPLSEPSNFHNNVEAVLQSGITCTILAPSGSQRMQLLKRLEADAAEFLDRNSPFLPILNSMLLETFVNKELAEKLNLVLGRNFEVLELAISEHNISLASKFYSSIELDRLSVLGDRTSAEKVAARMIIENRLDGYIDQELGLLYFHHSELPQQQVHTILQKVMNISNQIIVPN